MSGEKSIWVGLNDAVDIINKIDDSLWCHDFSLKYLKINIDTRDMHCIISDRGGISMTLNDLEERISMAKKKRDRMYNK